MPRFARFLAGFLIAGQWCNSPPAFAANTLRAGQEAQTRKSGLEKTLTAGTEENWPAVLPLRVIADFPALVPDPEVEKRLTNLYAKEIYRGVIAWMNAHRMEPPWQEELFGWMRTASNGRLSDKQNMEVAFQQVEKETAKTEIPIVEFSREAPPWVKGFMSAYVTELYPPSDRKDELFIPGGWTLERLEYHARKDGRMWFGLVPLNPRWQAFIKKIRSLPNPVGRALGDSVLLVSVPVQELGGAQALIEAHRKRGGWLDAASPKNGTTPRVREMEIVLPHGWDLLKLTEVVEASRPVLEKEAAANPGFRDALRQMDKVTGAQPDPVMTETQAKTVRAYVRGITRAPPPKAEMRLPSSRQISEERRDVSADTVSEHRNEIRKQFQGRRRAEVFLPAANRKEFHPMLEDWLRAYNEDHRPETRITVSAGRLYQMYILFQQLAGPDQRRLVPWEELGKKAGNIPAAEARTRFEALERLLRYVGIPLAEPRDNETSPARLMEKPPLDLPPPEPTREERLWNRFQELFEEISPENLEDWRSFLDLAREQMTDENVLKNGELLPVRMIEALHKKLETRLKGKEPKKAPTAEATGAAAGTEQRLLFREQWQGIRSRMPQMRWTVIGRSLEERFPQLKRLTELEGRLLIDYGESTAHLLKQVHASSVSYYGRREEARLFSENLDPGIFMEAYLPGQPEFQSQFAQILSLLGVEDRVIAEELEALAGGLEAVASGA